ncbi:hypothetical protein Saso_02800 [Streptomyces asoensis]|uniref:FXSXX-COOH protein n=1 Tax=Streptomyces asoensis TaxID=249586 RepID=A0ABQ3RRZ9_9ACTN|nr:hypothetical protein Saso_02800 [Streptomyces asoensis]
MTRTRRGCTRRQTSSTPSRDAAQASPTIAETKAAAATVTSGSITPPDTSVGFGTIADTHEKDETITANSHEAVFRSFSKQKRSY